ncbi:hypothetical protein FVEN_g13194 [Fusarium venenatum]|nr:hypothetical protein FVEN_g13194 [Fusarium venenatum]
MSVLPLSPQAWSRLACALVVSWGDICSLTIKPPAATPRSLTGSTTGWFLHYQQVSAN